MIIIQISLFKRISLKQLSFIELLTPFKSTVMLLLVFFPLILSQVLNTFVKAFHGKRRKNSFQAKFPAIVLALCIFSLASLFVPSSYAVSKYLKTNSTAFSANPSV